MKIMMKMVISDDGAFVVQWFEDEYQEKQLEVVMMIYDDDDDGSCMPWDGDSGMRLWLSWVGDDAYYDDGSCDDF